MALRFAPHIGLNSMDDGMFMHHAGNDPVDQINFIAGQGFAGVEDNFFKMRPLAEQKEIAAALEKHGLEMGAMVFNMNFEIPTLVSQSIEAKDAMKIEINTAIEAAKINNAKTLTTLSGITDQSLPAELQTLNMVDNLRWIGDEMGKHGLTLGVEAITKRIWAGVFLNSTRKALQIVKAVNHPHVKLIFDVFQAQVEDGDILRGLDESWQEIVLIQLADAPDRNEPGSGELNFKNILQRIHVKGFTGLVEMEHGHSRPGIDGEKHTLKVWQDLQDQIQ